MDRDIIGYQELLNIFTASGGCADIIRMLGRPEKRSSSIWQKSYKCNSLKVRG